MHPLTLIIIAAIVLYFGLGIMYVKMLLCHWGAFYRASKKRQTLPVLATFLWPIIFIVFITWRSFEQLTVSRRGDWE